jgi:hypothetical protein
VQQDNGAKFGLRVGHWKLQRPAGSRRADPQPPKELLFDLREDVAEKHDVAAANPEVLRRLSKMLDEAVAARTRPADRR